MQGNKDDLREYLATIVKRIKEVHLIMKRTLFLFVLVFSLCATPAFAAVNPFMDVPAGHWSYDAVAQLASRGVISGYPDGSYKGAQPATRYEMASIVSRALAVIDMDRAGRQDVELLRKLVLEFKNELDALGVKVNDLDKRVALLEDGIGGWNIRGIFVFSASFGDSDTDSYLYSTDGKKNEFDKEQFRLFLTKRIDDNTYFYGQYRTGGDDADGDGRGDQHHMMWSHLYVDTKLPWDVEFRIGRFEVDFEDDYGLYTDNDALMSISRTDGFQLRKAFGDVTATAVVGRNNILDDEMYGELGTGMTYALDLNWTPNERFFLGGTGYWYVDDNAAGTVDMDMNVYAIYAGYSFTPAISLKGIYYYSDYSSGMVSTFNSMGFDVSDSPKAWKAILDIGQDALKFTSLWVEYSQQDNSAPAYSDRYSIGGSAYDSVGENLEITTRNMRGTSKFWFVKAQQEWNDKWNTYLRFVHLDPDTAGLDNAVSYGVGVGYQYTPAIYFELAYDMVDHGSNNMTLHPDAVNDKESVIRFKTSVSF